MSYSKMLLEQVEINYDDTGYFEPKQCDTCTRKLVAQISKDYGRCASCRGMFKNLELLDSRQLATLDNDMQVRRNPYV